MTMRQRVMNFFAGFPALGMAPEKKLVPDMRELMNLIAYTDPSRVIANRLFSAFNPDILVARRGLGVFDLMKRDDQVKSALKFKKDAALAPGWEIVSPKGQDEDWEVTEFVRAQMTGVEGGPKKMLKKVMLGLDYGYSVTEKLYAPVEEGDWSGKIGLKKMISVKPHFIDFVVDEHGQLLSVIQRSVPVMSRSGEISTGNDKLIPQYPPAKFIIFSNEDEFENPYGESDLAAAYRPWWIKDNAYKWLAIYLERYGMPPLIAMYNAGAYQGNQLEQLKKFIRNIMNATFGIIPRYNKEDVELWSQELGTSSKEIFLDSIRNFNQDISRALLVPGLLGLTSEGDVGSLARSITQFDSFMLVLQDLQDEIEDCINAQLIPQLCDLNYPGLDEYPMFRFLPFKDDKRLEILKTWQTMVDSKIVNRIEDDETHIRSLMGFPENPDPVIEPLPADVAAKAKEQQPFGGGAKPKKANPKKLTQEQIEFAENNFAVWIESGGQLLCVDEAEWEALQ